MPKYIFPERALDWRLPVSGAAGAAFMFLSLILYSAYGAVLHVILVAPFVCLLALTLAVVAAIRKRYRRCLSMLLALVAFLLVSAALFKDKDALRASLRWTVESRRFKAEVLAQPAPSNGQLRHVEWEATGFMGIDQAVYLVFDPADSLALAAKSHSSGRFRGIPCEVPAVRRLERHWYSVEFYTDEEWGIRNALDCTGSDAE